MNGLKNTRNKTRSSNCRCMWTRAAQPARSRAVPGCTMPLFSGHLCSDASDDDECQCAGNKMLPEAQEQQVCTPPEGCAGPGALGMMVGIRIGAWTYWGAWGQPAHSWSRRTQPGTVCAGALCWERAVRRWFLEPFFSVLLF